MDYRKSATEVLAAIGGSKNIASAAHCATRLRLVIVDNGKVDKKTIENIEGVKGVFEASGQLQIIYGTGTVDKVYDEFINVAGISGATKEEAKAAPGGQPFPLRPAGHGRHDRHGDLRAEQLHCAVRQERKRCDRHGTGFHACL